MAIFKARLPQEYQEVEYIESTGTQYIDTGFKLNTNCKIVFDYLLSSSATFSPFGSFASEVGFTAYTADGNSRFGYYATGALTGNYNGYISNAKAHFELSLNGLYQNGTLIRTITSAYVEQAYNCYLFGRNVQGAPTGLGEFRFYNFKIYDNGTLVRDFIPCYRKADNVIGLYDLVNNVFYTNQGTGTFLKGANVMIKYGSVYKGATRMKKIYKGSQCVFNDLPQGYTKCEYIESHGTEYIDTGFKPNQDTKIEIDFANVGGWLFGERIDSSDANQLVAYIDGSSYGSLRFGNSTGYVDYSFNAIANTKNKLEVIKNGYTLNKTYSHNFVNISNFQSTLNLYLFGCNINGTTDADVSRIYSCKIYDNGALVRNFIPCLDTQGIPCLYDTVSKQPFYNQGTGTFGYKAKIPSGYQEVEYIECSGTQYIDTGVLPTSANLTKVVGSIALTDATKGYNQSLGKNGNLNMWASLNTLYFRLCGVNTNISIDTNKHSYTLQVLSDGRSIKFDSFVGSAGLPSQTEGATFALGALNDTTIAATYWGKYKIYNTQIFEQDNIVRNLIPCYRISDNEIGLYDVVNRKFYTNAGTGTFIKGPNV